MNASGYYDIPPTGYAKEPLSSEVRALTFHTRRILCCWKGDFKPIKPCCADHIKGVRIPGLQTELRFVRLLGEGGVGKVYSTSYQTTTAATKVFVDPDEPLSTFSFEQMAAMNQLGPVFVQDTGCCCCASDRVLAYATPLRRGQNLFDYLNEKKPLDLQVKCQIAFGVAEAIAALHEKGLFHCDISLKNFMFDDERVYLVDLEKIRSTSIDVDLTEATFRFLPVGFEEKLNIGTNLYSVARVFQMIFTDKEIDNLNLRALINRFMNLANTWTSQESVDALNQLKTLLSADTTLSSEALETPPDDRAWATAMRDWVGAVKGGGKVASPSDPLLSYAASHGEAKPRASSPGEPGLF